MATFFATDGGMVDNLPLCLALDMMGEIEDDVLILETTDGRNMAVKRDARYDGINWAAQDIYEFKDRDIIRGCVVVCSDGELEESHV